MNPLAQLIEIPPRWGGLWKFRAKHTEPQALKNRTTGIKGYMVWYSLMPDLHETKKMRTCTDHWVN